MKNGVWDLGFLRLKKRRGRRGGLKMKGRRGVGRR